MISQVLVFMYWQDAKFGTVANIIILVGCILGYGSWSFKTMVNNELKFFSPQPDKAPVVTEGNVSALPGPVQQWMEGANVIGKKMIQKVQFKQNGRMRTIPMATGCRFRPNSTCEQSNPDSCGSPM